MYWEKNIWDYSPIVCNKERKRIVPYSKYSFSSFWHFTVSGLQHAPSNARIWGLQHRAFGRKSHASLMQSHETRELKQTKRTRFGNPIEKPNGNPMEDPNGNPMADPNGNQTNPWFPRFYGPVNFYPDKSCVVEIV